MVVRSSSTRLRVQRMTMDQVLTKGSKRLEGDVAGVALHLVRGQVHVRLCPDAACCTGALLWRHRGLHDDCWPGNELFAESQIRWRIQQNARVKPQEQARSACSLHVGRGNRHQDNYACPCGSSPACSSKVMHQWCLTVKHCAGLLCAGSLCSRLWTTTLRMRRLKLRGRGDMWRRHARARACKPGNHAMRRSSATKRPVRQLHRAGYEHRHACGGWHVSAAAEPQPCCCAGL